MGNMIYILYIYTYILYLYIDSISREFVSSILKQPKIVIPFANSLWVDAARGLHDMVGDMFYSLRIVYSIY